MKLPRRNAGRRKQFADALAASFASVDALALKALCRSADTRALGYAPPEGA